MSEARFVSYAQHGEDVVIWRALKHVPDGFYVDVGAADPTVDSVTRALYERGWHGIHVEALSDYAARLRAARDGDVVVESAVGAESGEVTFYAVPGTGLSTVFPREADAAKDRGFGVNQVTVPVRRLDSILQEHLPPGREIHVLKVDVEGAEEAVLRGADLSRWRPWIVVLEATRPGSTERTSDGWKHHLTEAGYVECMFDGLNLWFRRDDHPELDEPLSYPACPLDLFVRPAKAAPGAAAKELAEARRARSEAERRAAQARAELVRARRSLAELRASPWWRLTRPGRSVVHRLKKVARRSRAWRGEASERDRPSAPAPPPPASEPVLVVPAGTPERVVLTRLSAMLAADGQPLLPSDQDGVMLAVRERLGGPARLRWLWALHVAWTGSLPSDATVERLDDVLVRQGVDAALALLQALADEVPADSWVRTADVELVRVPVVDVSHTATHDLHTGIQRVVREAVPRWAATHDCELLVLDVGARTYRRCSALEHDRVVSWPRASAVGEQAVEEPTTVVLPWQTQVLVPELPASLVRADLLRGLACHSSNRLGVIAYDMTPMTRAENASDTLPSGFARFLSVVKHAQRVSAISATVGHEFACFFAMLPAQGVTPPVLRTQPLAVAPRGTEGAGSSLARMDPGAPLVLSVSSLHPRKNHLRTLQAAERLWLEGVRFELLFLGGGRGRDRDAFDDAIAQLREAGRPVRVLADVDDDTLWQSYRQARCTVFVSFVEGFGLPAAEALAVGTPVVLSNYGAMAEIGVGGGALMVDPRDVDDITHALRTLLLDDEVHAELRAAALRRPVSSWDAYARQTWDWLVDGVEPSP